MASLTQRKKDYWKVLKRKGSNHYKAGEIEPIDLMKAGGLLYPGSIKDIIKYAYRCRPNAGRSTQGILEDMDKVIHYAEMVKAVVLEEHDALLASMKPKRKHRKTKPAEQEQPDAGKA